MKDFKIVKFFVRSIAVSILGYGLVRLPKLEVFSEWMVRTMVSSILPEGLVAV